MSTRTVNLALLVAVIATAVLGAVIIRPAEGRILAGLGIAGAAAAALAANYSIPRAPRLVVEYRNPRAGNEPVAWHGGQLSASPHVIVRNVGRAEAEAVEVRFTSPGGELFNESGNLPDPRYLDRTVQPPRFLSGNRVIGPGEEITIAQFAVFRHRPRAGPLPWEARARHMRLQKGEIVLEVLDKPPSDLS